MRVRARTRYIPIPVQRLRQRKAEIEQALRELSDYRPDLFSQADEEYLMTHGGQSARDMANGNAATEPED